MNRNLKNLIFALQASFLACIFWGGFFRTVGHITEYHQYLGHHGALVSSFQSHKAQGVLLCNHGMKGSGSYHDYIRDRLKDPDATGWTKTKLEAIDAFLTDDSPSN